MTTKHRIQLSAFTKYPLKLPAVVRTYQLHSGKKLSYDDDHLNFRVMADFAHMSELFPDRFIIAHTHRRKGLTSISLHVKYFGDINQLRHLSPQVRVGSGLH